MSNTKNGLELLQSLAQPMADNDIEWKVQVVTNGNRGFTALVVPYLQARAIQNRLDQVCGLNWKTSFRVLEGFRDRIAIECTIHILHNGEWISRSDAAEATHIEAVKGGYSDAFKRAAVQFSIGRFLYESPPQWVEILPQHPKGDCESVSSKYKVNGIETFVKGYFTKPSLSRILGNKPKQQNQQSSQQNQQQVNQQQVDPLLLREGYNNVVDCLQALNIHVQHVPSLFHMINRNCTLETANYEDLKLLFDILHPVKTFITLGRNQFGMPIEQLYGYASNLLQRPIGKISDLFQQLDIEKVQYLLNIIREDLQPQQQRRA